MKLILLILTTVYLQADVSNYTCTVEQFNNAKKEFIEFENTILFIKKYEKAIKRHCKKTWIDGTFDFRMSMI